MALANVTCVAGKEDETKAAAEPAKDGKKDDEKKDDVMGKDDGKKDVEEKDVEERDEEERDEEAKEGEDTNEDVGEAKSDAMQQSDSGACSYHVTTGATLVVAATGAMGAMIL